jgi:hypothetical protein
VSKSAVNDFDSKFGLSVRVKAMLKLILPSKHYATIDRAAEAIRHRNKIMHEGWTDANLDQSKTEDLVKACSELVHIIKRYRTQRFPTSAFTATAKDRRA